MKKYKECVKTCIGSSDISTLILVGCSEEGIKIEPLYFGEDGCYKAYIVTEDTEIGSHYSKVASFTDWMKIYDDDEKTFEKKAKKINVYRAGEFGCIIQIIQQ